MKPLTYGPLKWGLNLDQEPHLEEIFIESLEELIKEFERVLPWHIREAQNAPILKERDQGNVIDQKESKNIKIRESGKKGSKGPKGSKERRSIK